MPYFNGHTKIFESKARPCVLYNKAGEDFIFLPIAKPINDKKQPKKITEFVIEVQLDPNKK